MLLRPCQSSLGDCLQPRHSSMQSTAMSSSPKQSLFLCPNLQWLPCHQSPEGRRHPKKGTWWLRACLACLLIQQITTAWDMHTALRLIQLIVPEIVRPKVKGLHPEGVFFPATALHSSPQRSLLSSDSRRHRVARGKVNARENFLS